MKRKVVAKQPNSKICIVCGLKNPAGLHAAFYELDSGELMSVFHAREDLNSYPGRLHGGITTAVLDETIGRSILIRSKGEIWGVTVEFTTRFRKTVPTAGKLRVIGRIVKDGRRFFEGTGELLLEDGSVAAEGCGRYLKMPLESIADFDFDEQEWKITALPDDPVELEVGE